VNGLPQFCAVGVETDANVHFHGLHSSPLPPGDNVVTTKAVPGGSTGYVIHINPDQPPGLYWYHAHVHGLSAWEVGNGLSGAIVVEGIANYVPQTAGLRERVIVLRDPPVSSSLAAGEQSVLRRTASVALAAGARNPLDGDSTGGNACHPETDIRAPRSGDHQRRRQAAGRHEFRNNPGLLPTVLLTPGQVAQQDQLLTSGNIVTQDATLSLEGIESVSPRLELYAKIATRRQQTALSVTSAVPSTLQFAQLRARYEIGQRYDVGAELRSTLQHTGGAYDEFGYVGELV
jgi:hypothetical protein